ncbi:MAG: ShlB/FhaC/HecB family hemolysin secretion/activation protein [Alphaproteobacteria bacterium]|nr:ShlB/FhaC/HecB family hemolysin secretion/activation protein [Alphaproteobacteria bacterium]
MAKFTKRLILLIILLISTCPSLSQAQSVVIPRGVEAGNIEKQLTPPPQPESTPIIPDEYTPLGVPSGAENITLQLRDVTVEGSTVYSQRELERFYKKLLGEKVSLADVYGVADRIRNLYHQDGYILTQVFLPPQDINNGNVRIHITEGYISQLRWIGDEIQNSIPVGMAAAITESKPFNADTLEDVMLRLNEIPGVFVQASLEPLPAETAEEGAVGLVLSVDRNDYSGSIGVDNFASRYLGVWQSNARLEAYHLLSDVDRVSITTASSYDPARLRYGALQYTLPIHKSGTALSLSVNNSYTHPGYLLKDLNVVSRAAGLSLSATQPLIRSRIQSLSITGQFNIRRQETRILQADFTEDRMRTVDFITDYNMSDEWGGTNTLSAQLSHGLNLFNPTRPGSLLLSNPNGQNDFTKLLLNGSRLQTIDRHFSLLAAFTAQKSSSALLSSEQFGYGGSSFGRAYNASELSGDEGIAVSTELRYTTNYQDINLQPYIFYDIGAVSDREAFGTTVSGASFGIGGRAQWRALRLDASLSLPLTYTPGTPKLGSTNKDPVFAVSVTQGF